MFRITEFGHLEHIYYNSILDADEKADTLARKRTIPVGSSVVYDESDELYSLDNMCLEWSDNGRGDYRQSPSELKMPDGSFVSDFVYSSHEIKKASVPMETLPSAYDGDWTLIIELKDTTQDVALFLHYTIFEKANVITRRAVLINKSENPLVIRRLMSMTVDLPDGDFNSLTLDGGWIKEAHLHKRPLEYGILVNSSITGNSSNRHNPGFILAYSDASEDSGRVYGFNLIYSGNHFGSAEKSSRDYVRVSIGINPHCFEWNLARGERFETPEAVMTFSGQGYNGMSHNMHDFVNNHIVRGLWKNRERPVLANNWEATFFYFDEHKLFELAKSAKELGAELFVLDDGWFGERNSDKAGLGDYSVNRKKLPHGLVDLSERIRSLGLDFGLWFEPEMVNPESGLYRTHPEYAVRHPDKKSVFGRHQLVLDLCRKEVRDYIVENVGKVLDEADVRYVKWDMNRHIAENYSPTLKNQGEFYHRYIMGLYDVLSRIFGTRPHILLESCSSGGNRFDLGMLCFSPQIWSSDDTDPIERLKIQSGLSYFYPPSTFGAHVSDSPHQQTLRNTPLNTRFHAACFGCLGYELDIGYLSPEEKKDIKDQIAFYKKYRRIFQYGTFSRIKENKNNKVVWQSVSEDKNSALTGFFQTIANAAESDDKLIVTGLNKGRYEVQTRPQRLYIERFGGLVKHILPAGIKPGTNFLRAANRHYSLKDCMERYECSSKALMAGIPLNSQFQGTGYNKNVRMLSDFGSNLYITEKINREEER
jgi:alpha-galactosidase